MIPKLEDALVRAKRAHPQQRFGQLINNALHNYGTRGDLDRRLFFIKDEDLIQALNVYAEMPA